MSITTSTSSARRPNLPDATAAKAASPTPSTGSASGSVAARASRSAGVAPADWSTTTSTWPPSPDQRHADPSRDAGAPAMSPPPITAPTSAGVSRSHAATTSPSSPAAWPAVPASAAWLPPAAAAVIVVVVPAAGTRHEHDQDHPQQDASHDPPPVRPARRTPSCPTAPGGARGGRGASAVNYGRERDRGVRDAAGRDELVALDAAPRRPPSRRDRLEQHLERHPDLEAGDGVAEAVVDAVAEAPSGT